MAFRVPSFRVTLEPCQDGMTMEGRTIVAGVTASNVNSAVDGKTVVILPGGADAASGARVSLLNLIKLLSIIKQGTSTASLSSDLDALNP